MLHIMASRAKPSQRCIMLAPVQPVPGEDVVDSVDVGPLVDHLAPVAVNVDLLEDGRSDPGL